MLSCDKRGFLWLRLTTHSLPLPCGEWQANESSDSITLRTVGRPKAGAGHVGQHGQIGCWHLRNGVHRLSTVGTAQKAPASVVEGRIFLEIVRPIGGSDHEIGAPIGFDSVLVDGGVDHAQIVQDSAGLGTFACAEEPGHRDRGQERDDRNNDHDFNEGETPAATVKFVKHCVKLLSVL